MEEQQRPDLIFKSKVNLKSEEEYRAYNAINQSTLSDLDKNPRKVLAERKESDALLLGSLIDNLLTKGHYGDEYILNSADRPSGQLGDFCDYLYEERKMGNPNAQETAYLSVGFKKYKLETVLNRFNKEGVQYFEMLKEAEGKKLVDMSTISQATRVVNGLKESEYTRVFFGEGDLEGVEILYQVPIVFDLPEGKGEGKALLDVVVIDHRNKSVYLYDLKTTGFLAASFRISFIKFKYYLQASFYYYGFKSICQYDVKGFNFIVASTIDPDNPLLWRTTQKDLYVGKNGINRPNSNEMLKGWGQLVDELIWHRERNQWSYPYEFYNRDKNELDVFSRWE